MIGKARSVCALAVCAALLVGGAGCGGDDEREARNAILELQRAIARDDSVRACALLTDAAIGHLGSLGHGASRGCVRDLAAFSKAVDYSGGGREATRPRVRSVSVDGDRAMATVAVVDGPSGEVPLAKEDGEWKVDALYGGIPAAEQRDKFQ